MKNLRFIDSFNGTHSLRLQSQLEMSSFTGNSTETESKVPKSGSLAGTILTDHKQATSPSPTKTYEQYSLEYYEAAEKIKNWPALLQNETGTRVVLDQHYQTSYSKQGLLSKEMMKGLGNAEVIALAATFQLAREKGIEKNR